MSSETAIKFLLNHFIKGRLYDRNLKNDEVFESIGGSGLKIQRIATGKIRFLIGHQLKFHKSTNEIIAK